MTKYEKEIYDTLIELVEQDEKEMVEKEPLKTNTQICEEESYNYQPGYKMPQAFQCGGIANVGKYLRVDTDGYIRPLPGSGGSGGYEPDFTTIGLTSNSELAVIDYISATEAEALVQANVAFSLDAPNLTSLKVGDTIYKITGGGEGDPIILIKGTANIVDPTSLVDIPITITSPNFYDTLEAFYEENGRLPRVIADVVLEMSGVEISHVQIDMFANNIDLENEKIEVEGALCEETKSVSYIEFKFEPERQEGSLSSIQLQERLDENSEIEVKKIWFDNYYIDKLSLVALLSNVNRLVEKELPTFVNDKYLKVVNGALSWEDAGGSGGSKYYLHTVSFNTRFDDLHFQVGVITKNSATYTDLDAFWNDIRKIVSIFGTPNISSSTKQIYFNGALADNNTIFVRGIDNDFDVITKNISKIDVDDTSFGDYGVEEL